MAYSNLSVGSSGSDVKKLQNALISAGYSVGSSGADGIYGSNTEAAVKKYQAANGLSVDGIAGNNTLSKLYGSSSGTNTSAAQTTSSTNTTVPSQYDASSDKAYQTALSALQEAQKNTPTYAATYDSQLKDLYDQIVNRDKFTYDINSDAIYQQYKDQYVNLGKQAMMDATGQAAAMTGGYGNSYAQAVGQQQYNNYLKQLGDIVPDLYSQAYQQYQDEGDRMTEQYGLLGDLADDEYSKYQDAYNRWLSEREYAQANADTAYERGYSSWADQLAQQNADRDYQLSLAQFNYQKEQDALDRAAAASSSSGTTTSKPTSSASAGRLSASEINKSSSGGMNPSTFNGYMSSIVASAKAGNETAVANRVNEIYDQLNDTQKEDLRTTLNKLGYDF